MRAQKLKTRLVATAFAMLILGSSQAFAACPTQDWVCEYWPPLLGYSDAVPTGWCEGPSCYEKNYGEETTVVASDDVLFPDKWLFRHSGFITNINCDEATETKDKKEGEKTTVWVPQQRHCAVLHQTENHLYIQFIASNPETLCMGWVECKID